MNKITILIAVYNTGKYLRKCLDSLLRQTYTDFQAICIDDCSDDESPAILRDYASRDSRFEIIRLEHNCGQAHARNIGLRQAKGELVCFLDSDDWLSDNALAEAASAFDSHPLADCVLFRVVNVEENGEETMYPMDYSQVFTGPEAFELSLTWKIHGVYMVRTSIHQKYPYDETCHSYSDDNTTRLHYLCSREVRSCYGIYYYRQHASSTSHQITVKQFDYLKANKSMKRQMKQIGASRRQLDLYENVRWLNVVGLYKFWYLHQKQLGKAGSTYGLSKIREAWSDIDLSMLTFRNRMKPGYIPFHFSWMLFRMEEEVYFGLKKIFNRW